MAPDTDSLSNTPAQPDSRPPEGARMIAMVATAQPIALSFEDLRAEMLHRFAAMPMNIEPLPSAGKNLSGGLLFAVDGVPITVLFVDQPIPQGDIDEACRGSRIGWPKAAEELAQHRAHAVVGMVVPPDSHNGMLNGAAYVTLVAGAIAALTSAIGVYWTAAQAVQATADFLRGANTVAKRQIPTDTWVRLDLLQGSANPDDGLIAAVTVGLYPFVGRELEFSPQRLPPLVIAQRMVGTVQYLILNGMVLNDGDTIGIDQRERIRVRFAEQGQRPGVPVARLTAEQADTSTQH